MTPKEKAKELLEKYCLALKTEGNEFEYWTNVIQAKQCALISVGEIIKALRKDLPEVGLGKGYWFNVREEIKKI